MRTPIEEREIHVSAYTYKEDGTRNDKLCVYTSDYSMMAKFDKYCEENPEHWKHVKTETSGGDIVGKRYECSWECVFFRAKPVKQRPRTEEEKQIARERMMKMREDGIL